MKVGILTLPLHTNYGGVLQAYALQYSLHILGHECHLIDCRVDPRYANLIKRPAAALLSLFSGFIPPLRPLEHAMRSDKVVMRRNTELFIKKHIPMRHYCSYRSIKRGDFDAIVVGSDQVWRPEYFAPITAAYLDFAKSWSIKRVAYAASFGVDNWEYSDAQSLRCRSLAQRFDAISLRESSAVELCREHLGCDATLCLDPTLLLTKEHYLSLVDLSEVQRHSGGVMVSVLDGDSDKELLVKRICKQYSAESFSVNSRVEDRNAPLEARVQPPVGQWLQGFADADYIVTDSYHASLFAIIFNKPFIAYGNRSRGYARFSSLLMRLGLESQFVTSASEVDLQSCFDIEWGSVNRLLDGLREESLDFLRKSLDL